MLFIKLCLQYCSIVYIYSVFCLKNERRQRGPPLPRLEAESSLGTGKTRAFSLKISVSVNSARQKNALPLKIVGKSR